MPVSLSKRLQVQAFIPPIIFYPMIVLLLIVCVTFIVYGTKTMVQKKIAWRRRLRDATPVTIPPTSLPLQPAKPRLRVFVTSAISDPTLIGFRNPCLYLPKRWETLREDHLRSIIAHETASRSIFNQWVFVLQKLALILFGVNPLVRLLDRQLTRLRKLCCDEVARKTGIDPIEHSKLLYEYSKERHDFVTSSK